MKSIARVLACILILSFALTACIPAQPSPTAVPPAAEPTEPAPAEPTAVPEAEATMAPEATAETDTTTAEQPPAEQEVTLKVWDILVNETETRIADQLNKEFEEANPGVTIVRESKTFDQMKTTAKLGLGAADGPDVAQINQGYSDMGALVAADLLVDLTPYIQQYGWDKIISPGIVTRNSFSPDGKSLGEGNFYGIFEQYGITVPKTFAEFEAAMQKVKDAGDVAINYGSLDGFVNIHVFAEIQNLGMDRKSLDDFIYSHPGATFNTPNNLEAAQIMMNWVDNGYFTPDFSGIGVR